MKPFDPIAERCKDWLRWCDTRRFYLRPPAKSLLARMQPSKSGTEPDARNDADMQFFNMAIHTLADMPKWRREWASFKAHYLGEGRAAKCEADALGIGRRTYYDHIKRFAAAAYHMAPSIKAAHLAMMEGAAEVEKVQRGAGAGDDCHR